ncbi:hypothetical protein [Nannocystis exedens]|uniref:hypothetical protein n=1 Tax=Nannocystis exedens TaxID=54 RepID=UPI000BBA01C8|nr:hypothetical protein [Nannocystis exedens]
MRLGLQGVEQALVLVCSLAPVASVELVKLTAREGGAHTPQAKKALAGGSGLGPAPALSIASGDIRVLSDRVALLRADD